MRNDDDEEDGLEPEPETIEHCLRLWRQALAGEGTNSVYGVADWAAELAVDAPEVRAMWIRSIQILRASGEIGADLSLFIIDGIVEAQCDQTDVFADRGLLAIHERMTAFERAYGYEWPGIFDNNPNAPREWIALQRDWDAREEERRRELFRAAGEDALVSLRTEDPVEYWIRLDDMRRRLERDHWAMIRRTWNEEVDGPFPKAM